VAAVVSIRRDEGSLFLFGTKLRCVLNQAWPGMRRRDRTSEGYQWARLLSFEKPEERMPTLFREEEGNTAAALNASGCWVLRSLRTHSRWLLLEVRMMLPLS
jgi:hypothetical protein